MTPELSTVRNLQPDFNSVPDNELTSIIRMIKVCGYYWSDNQRCFIHSRTETKLQLNEIYQIYHSDFTLLKKRLRVSRGAFKLISHMILSPIGDEVTNDINDSTDVLNEFGNGFPIYSFLITDEKLHLLNDKTTKIRNAFLISNFLLLFLLPNTLYGYIFFAVVINIGLLANWFYTKTQLDKAVDEILTLEDDKIIEKLDIETFGELKTNQVEIDDVWEKVKQHYDDSIDKWRIKSVYLSMKEVACSEFLKKHNKQQYDLIIKNELQFVMNVNDEREFNQLKELLLHEIKKSKAFQRIPA